MVFSPRQRELLFLFLAGRLRRLNVLGGAVRSGKTYVSLVLWAMWACLDTPRDAVLLMAAKTLTSLKRNCLGTLQAICGEHFSYSLAAKEGRLLGRKVLLEGAGDARAEGKIRGLTLHGAYCDELSLFPEDFFWMLLARLSQPGAMLLATTNPGHPGHWLKRKVLERAGELNLLEMDFALDDNMFLDEGYRRAVEQEHSGAFYRRYVLGQWCAAEGAVYPQFAENPEAFSCDAPDYDFIHVGVDFGGNKSAFAFVACGLKRDYSHLAALSSERHPGAGMTPEVMYRRLADFITRVEGRWGRVAAVYADSAEQTLINGLRGRLRVPVRNSLKKRIMDRVRAACALMAAGRLSLSGDCGSLREALRGAVYDEGCTQDARLDDGSSDIDTLDAFEYGWERYLEGYARRTVK